MGGGTERVQTAGWRVGPVGWIGRGLALCAGALLLWQLGAGTASELARFARVPAGERAFALRASEEQRLERLGLAGRAALLLQRETDPGAEVYLVTASRPSEVWRQVALIHLLHPRRVHQIHRPPPAPEELEGRFPADVWFLDLDSGHAYGWDLEGTAGPAEQGLRLWRVAGGESD